MGLLDFLRRLVDPAGPIGSLLSPSPIFKERQGFRSQIAAPPIVAPAKIEAPAGMEHLTASPRFLSLEQAAIEGVPADRVRQVSAFVQERWEPVYASTTSTDLASILLSSQQQIGWKVVCEESRASREARRARVNREQFEEICQTAQIQATDDFYNQYYDTIPGNDPVILDGEVLMGNPEYEILPGGKRGKLIKEAQPIRGGTNITGGRRQYREATKGMVHWDKGFLEKREAALAEEASRPVRNVRRAMEHIKGQKLPMWSPVGINMRRDRRSAV